MHAGGRGATDTHQAVGFALLSFTRKASRPSACITRRLEPLMQDETIVLLAYALMTLICLGAVMVPLAVL